MLDKVKGVMLDSKAEFRGLRQTGKREESNARARLDRIAGRYVSAERCSTHVVVGLVHGSHFQPPITFLVSSYWCWDCHQLPGATIYTEG